MGIHRSWRLVTIAAAGLVLAAAPARAGLYPTATLPPPGAVYPASGGIGCFSAVGVCVAPGMLEVLDTLSETFDAAGQTLVVSARLSTVLTTLGGTVIAPFAMLGSFTELVALRTGPDETGTWDTPLLAAEFEGTLAGKPVAMHLDPDFASGGTTSVAPAGSNLPGFRIDSFFDVFVTLTYGDLSTDRGPLHLELAAVPEPATAALLGLAVLPLLRRRRQ